MSISMGWALFGKQGDSAHYTIRAVGPGRTKDEAERLVLELIPGNPRPFMEPSDPDVLPWVTIGNVQDSSRRSLIGTVITEPGETVSGRLNISARYFESSFETFAGAQAGFVSIYDAVAGVALPAADRVVGEVARLDGSSLPRDPTRLSWLLRATALLLDKPVTIDGRKSIPGGARERLTLLDAVASFLPYGFRADLVVSTWVPRQRPRGPRLAFGSEGDHGVTVEWGSDLVSIPLSQVASDYLARLDELVRRWGAERVVQRLAHAQTAQSFSAPEGALQVLDQLDFPIRVAAAIRGGRGSPADAVKVIATNSPGSLDDDIREDVAAFVAARAPQSDLLTLAPHWSPALKTVLVREALGTKEPDRPEALLRVASAARAWESFLVEMLSQVKAADPGSRAHQQTLFVSLLGSFEPPRRSFWPTLRHDLLGDASLACQLLFKAPKDDVLGWLDWLVDGAPDRAPRWLAAVRAAWDGAYFGDQETRELTAVGPAAVATAVRLAVANGRLEQVIGQLWGPLQVQLVVDGFADRHQVVHLLAGAGEMHLGRRASIDLLLAGAGHPLAPLPSDRPRSAWPEYLSGLVSNIPRAAAPEQTVQRYVGVLLDGGLRDRDDDTRCVEFALQIAESLGSPGRERVLRQTAVATRPQAATLLTLLPTAMQDALEPYSPELKAARARSLLEVHAGRDAEPRVLADDWLAMRDRGHSVPDILAVLREHWRRRSNVSSVVALLAAVRERAAARDGNQEGRKRYIEGLRGVIDGGLGSAVADGYRRQVVRQVREADEVRSAVGVGTNRLVIIVSAAAVAVVLLAIGYLLGRGSLTISPATPPDPGQVTSTAEPPAPTDTGGAQPSSGAPTDNERAAE